MRMTNDTLRQVLDAEIQSSVTWAQSAIREEQLKNLQYYLGYPMGNEVPGRSQVVSWDVFEVIESAMPGFIEPFFASDRIGEFQPKTPEDEAYCEQASDYVNYIIKERNEGFLLFQTWIKDALLSKVGVVRGDWVKGEKRRRRWEGLTDEQLALLQQDEGVELIEHSEYPVPGLPPLNEAQIIQMGGAVPMLHDVVVLEEQAGCVELENVRPENFVVSRGVSSTKKAKIVGDWVTMTRSELKEAGFAKYMDVQSLESAEAMESDGFGEARERDGFGEAESEDPALEEVRLFRGFLRVDYDGDGIAEWRRVLVGGGEDGFLENEEADGHNYAIITPIPIPHRVIGMGYADPARQIQDLKTGLTRNFLDSVYLANRPRTYVNTAAGVSLDDLLSERIGGIVRGTGPADTAIRPIQTTLVAREALDGIQLADGMRETRLGIAKFNPGLEADALHQTATGVRSINNSVDKRQKMTLRTMAETGIKELFRLVLRLVTKYQDREAMIRLRGQWVPFDPRGWNADLDCSVSVGVGTSDETETMMMLQQFAQFMQWGQANGCVTPQNVYEFGLMLAKNARLKGADTKLLTDPSKQPPKPPPPGPLEIEQMKAQIKAQTDAQKMQADMQLDRERMQLQAQVDTNRQEVEARQQALRAQQDRESEQVKLEAQMRLEEFKARLDQETQMMLAKLRAETDLTRAQVQAQTTLTQQQNDAADAAVADGGVQ